MYKQMKAAKTPTASNNSDPSTTASDEGHSYAQKGALPTEVSEHTSPPRNSEQSSAKPVEKRNVKQDLQKQTHKKSSTASGFTNKQNPRVAKTDSHSEDLVSAIRKKQTVKMDPVRDSKSKVMPQTASNSTNMPSQLKSQFNEMKTEQGSKVPVPPPLPSQKHESNVEDNTLTQFSKDACSLSDEYMNRKQKLPFYPHDLLNQKRLLRKVDRMAEFNPVTLGRKELFEDEYTKYHCYPPEYLPLHVVKPVISSQNISADLVTLNLTGIDQLTDVLFPILHGGGTAPLGNYTKLKKLLLVGCVNLTDQGLVWISKLFTDLHMIEINACRKVTEKGLHYLFTSCGNLQNVIAMATNAALIPDSIMKTKVPSGSLQWAGCPIITQGKDYYTTYQGSDPDSYFEPNKRKLVILRDESLKEEITPILTKSKSLGKTLFHYHNSFPVSGDDPSSPLTMFNIFEIPANSPVQDSLVSEGSVIIITYKASDDKKNHLQDADRIADTISSVIIKSPDVMFLLVEMTGSDNKSNLNEMIKNRLAYLANSLYTTTYKLYTSTWRLEFLDFKGQQGLGWGISSLETLEGLTKTEDGRMLSLCVTNESFSREVTNALSKCATEIKKHVPWVHCEWSKEVRKIIEKMPKTAARCQTSIFHETDREARTHHHKRYSFPRFGKVVNLLQNWGESLYLWHEHKSLCVTDMQAYENLFTKLLSGKPPDKVKVSFLGCEIPCWKLSSVKSAIQAEKLTVEVCDAVAVLKRQGMLLAIPGHMTSDSQSETTVFIRTHDIPDEPEILKSLWPEPCPKPRILQTSRCYSILPSLPPSFVPILLRTLTKVYQPLYVWKTGFLLRQGPVDIKVCLCQNKGSDLDKTPVLIVSARVVHLQMNTGFSSGSDEFWPKQEPSNAMFSCLRQVITLIDFVCQKTKVYSYITLPCPECTKLRTEEVINTDKNCYFPYYLSLANKHKSCKIHKNINASHICDVNEEKGVGSLVPVHNYPYHLAASAFIKETGEAEHHRPLDPTEKCFYCGSVMDVPCLHCVMCANCTKQFAKFVKSIEPGQITSRSFKLLLLKDGEMTDDDRIINNTKGCVYYYKKGHRMQLHQAMDPFYWNEMFITILKGASFFLHMTFGTGKKLEYHGHAATVVDQEGQSHQNELWKSRDTNVMSIRLESVVLGKRVRVVICLRGLVVHTEEVDGWQMKLDINSEKAGVYIIHVPGMKETWQMHNSSFTMGATLEVAENKYTTHPAVIVEKTNEGYLTLDLNGVQRKYIFSSPQLMPTGTTRAMSSSLASTLNQESEDGKSSHFPCVPAWSFMEFQVPCGFETLLKSNMSQEGAKEDEQEREKQEQDLSSVIRPCTSIDFPSVLYGRQVHLRDKVEKTFFTDGKWNFSMLAFLMMPNSLTKDDFVNCSQSVFSGSFKLNPLCQFRGDVNTVMCSGPAVPQSNTLECFHCVHMLDNEGFQVDVFGVADGLDSSLGILWAWTLMLLRLQHDQLREMNALTRGILGLENMSTQQVYEGFKGVIQAVNHALFLCLGKNFNFSSSLNDQSFKRWKDLMQKHAETQGLVKVKPMFVDESLFMCESHQATWQINKSLENFKGVPGLYGHFVYSVNISGNNLHELQTELFFNMPNLKDLNLSANKLVSLPSEICKCSKLVTLSLGENYLKELPNTLERCTDLMRLDIDKNYFEKFPPVIVKLKQLKRLYAQFLYLLSLPDEIGDLSDLQTLSLNGNCLTSLPDSISKLQNLENLSLNGVQWIKLRSNSLLSKENFEDFLKTNNLNQWLNRHKQNKSTIFHFFDQDTNGTLDPKEIGKLNATMFHAFPRFGYTGKEPPDDDTPCGFPEVLCELRKLQYLSIQFQGIVAVPESIKKMTSLQTLHLGNNPNLTSISEQAGSLPLKRIELECCPRLKTPPKEIRAKGFHTTLAYLKRLLSGSVSCQRTKLMLVGLGGAGKTSLVKALMSENKKVQLTVQEEITDGIDICSWTVPTKEGNITYNVWDFAGQTVYYNTHQFFLSDRAVYFLIWNIRLGHEHAGLGFWLNSITVHAPKAPIFVIGTHVDQVSKVQLPVREMHEKYSQICGFHFVSSHSGQGIHALQEQLIEVTLKQQYMGEKIPGVWLNFEESIKSVQDKSIIEYREAENLANKSGIFEKTEVIQAIQFLHELGALQHFTNANLRTHIVVNPQWIVDVMACVVSVKDSPIREGRLQHSDIAKVWKDYDPSLYKWLLKLTEEFDLTFPLKEEQVNLVPCLLPEKKPEFDWPEPDKNSSNKESKIVYVFEYLPAGLFNRAQVRLHQFSDSALIWKRGSYLKKNGHVCLIYQSRKSELTVKAYGPRPDNIVLLVHEVFENLILESFQGITYDFYIPCPDCMKEVVKDPYMFAASIIRRATELKAPFLQCLKYFHTISITELHAIMPPDSNKDFDLHLVQAVRGMKELQQDLAADVFASYCPADTEIKHDEMIVPSKVLEDLEKLGYRCWRPRVVTAESTDEMARALIDAKIFLVFMSNNFVQDETCCNLFKYARLTLHKPVLLVALGDNFSWKQSNMGILMADEVYINMMKASHYNHKFEELQAMLKDKHAVEKKQSIRKNFPPCFISYCWQNSAQAVAKGSKTTEGAIGYGDPRTIKDFLEHKGIKCWIDVERVGIHGLFEDIGEGLINCRVVVVCMSDQYAASDNCAMEFRYAANTLKLPIILAVVGTGNKWRASELGILSLNYPLVSCQEQSNSALDKLYDLVCSQIQSHEKNAEESTSLVKEMERDEKNAEEQQKLSFQELCELVQRKFLRQVSQYADRLDPVPYPNIILVDFCAETKSTEAKVSEGKELKGQTQSGPNEEEDGAAAVKKTKLSPTLSESITDFHEQRFCAHLLCEHEEGWHAAGESIVLDTNFGHTIEQYLPYIARITAIAKYSKKLVLNSLATDFGQSYLKWLEENPSVTVITDFQETYGALRQVVQDADTSKSMGKLERCLLPSGKYSWLCETHRKAMRVTVLERESQVTTTLRQSETMGLDYMLQALQELDVDLLPEQFMKAQAGTLLASTEDASLKSGDVKLLKSTTNKTSTLQKQKSAHHQPTQPDSTEKIPESQRSTASSNQDHIPTSQPKVSSKACMLM